MMKSIFLGALLVAVASIADVDAMAVAKAPVVTCSVFEESYPMLIASKLVYDFGDVVKQARERGITLKVPAEFPLKDLCRFENESIDLTEFNNGSGISFRDLNNLMVENKDVLSAVFDDNEFEMSLIDNMRKFSSMNGDDSKCGHFLATYRSIQADVSCVYGVIKDTQSKKIILSFRGSQSPMANRDWRTNLNAATVSMRTPKKIKDKMNGKLQERVLVHKGFYNYLFNNDLIDGEQRYDKILADIEPLMEEGYSLYVTGHSLGGALATMFSFKLAGAGPKRDWVPRPLTCITYAAPFTGTGGYRAAFELEEQAGLIRSLRVTNGEDVVPAAPPFSYAGRPMKHTGINLRLTRNGIKLRHSTTGGLWNTISNSVFKPLWSALTWHLLPLHDDRMENSSDELKKVTLDDLYKDDKVVSKGFMKGEATQDSDVEDEE